MLAKVAIVGRPNVGKSTLFNRIIGSRLAITDDAPGITRDRIYAKGEWLGRSFDLIDTGGIELKDAPFLEEIKAQALLAIDQADCILFVIDVRCGVTDNDRYIARILQKTKKPLFLVANKVDDKVFAELAYDFYELGCGVPYPVSSIHGIGLGDLLDEAIKVIPERSDPQYDNIIPISLIGRPNVGKSSLTNAILGDDRVIVSDIPGTTRDSIDTIFTKDGQKYVIIDTAGIRKRGKIYEKAEKYSVIRAIDAIKRSDVVLLILDAITDIIEQDKHVCNYLTDAKKACLIVINKWDAIKKDSNEMKRWETKIREEFKFLPYVRVAFTSALEEKRLHTLFPLIQECYANYKKMTPTPVLNDLLSDAVVKNPPALFNHGIAKFYYINQVAIKPPTFVIFVNNPDFVHFSYERYLENEIRKNFDFTGTPIKIIFRKRD